jgi:hypothetical protein
MQSLYAMRSTFAFELDPKIVAYVDLMTTRRHNYYAYRKFVLDAAAFMPPPAKIAVEEYCNNLKNDDIKALLDKHYNQFRPPHLEFQAIVSRQCNLSKIFKDQLSQLHGFGDKKAQMFLPNSQFVIMHWPYEAFHIINNPEDWRTSILKKEARGKGTFDNARPLYTVQDTAALRNWVQSFYPTYAPTDLSDLANSLRKFPTRKLKLSSSA